VPKRMAGLSPVCQRLDFGDSNDAKPEGGAARSRWCGLEVIDTIHGAPVLLVSSDRGEVRVVVQTSDMKPAWDLESLNASVVAAAVIDEIGAYPPVGALLFEKMVFPGGGALSEDEAEEEGTNPVQIVVPHRKLRSDTVFASTRDGVYCVKMPWLQALAESDPIGIVNAGRSRIDLLMAVPRKPELGCAMAVSGLRPVFVAGHGVCAVACLRSFDESGEGLELLKAPAAHARWTVDELSRTLAASLEIDALEDGDEKSDGQQNLFEVQVGALVSELRTAPKITRDQLRSGLQTAAAAYSFLQSRVLEPQAASNDVLARVGELVVRRAERCASRSHRQLETLEETEDAVVGARKEMSAVKEAARAAAARGAALEARVEALKGAVIRARRRLTPAEKDFESRVQERLHASEGLQKRQREAQAAVAKALGDIANEAGTRSRPGARAAAEADAMLDRVLAQGDRIAGLRRRGRELAEAKPAA